MACGNGGLGGLFIFPEGPNPQRPSLTSLSPFFAANGGSLREWLSGRGVVLEDHIRFINVEFCSSPLPPPGLATLFDNRIIIIYIAARSASATDNGSVPGCWGDKTDSRRESELAWNP